MSCAVGTLSTAVPGGILLCACGCGKWACGKCSRFKVRRIVDAIVAGKPTHFLTFTWDASRPESPERAREIMGAMWKLVVARIRRRYPGVDFHYFTAVERTKRGYPHFHVMARCGYVDQAWLSRVCGRLWGAPIVDIRLIECVYGLAFYLAGYLTKSLAKIGNGKRYWFSQGFHPDEEPEDAKRRLPGPWFRDDHSPMSLLAYYATKGWRKISGTDTRMVIARGAPP